MSKPTGLLLSALAALLVLVTIPTAALAATKTLTVSPTSTFTTIQAAIQQIRTNRSDISAPLDTYIIEVQSSSADYVGAVTIDGTTNINMSYITIEGTSTQDTTLKSGNPSIPTITITGTNASNINIGHFTFVANSAISVSGGASVINITNNVFTVGTGSNTAIQVADASNVSIVNNTFYLNGTAIQSGSNLLIDNNIFARNTTAISGSVTPSSVTYNDFFLNTSIGIVANVNTLPNTNVPNVNSQVSDPKFVSAGSLDFHLGPGSAASGTGDPSKAPPGASTSDMGAYGGANAEPSIPQVTGLSADTPVGASDGTFSIPLTWNAVSVSGVTVTNYIVNYGLTSGNLGSQVTVPAPSSGTTVSTTLSGLVPAFTGSETISPPRITSIAVRNGALDVSWAPSSNATPYTVYKVFYSTTTPATGGLAVDAGSATSTTIPGLTNGTTYFIAVQASEQTTVFITVTAADANGNTGSASDMLSVPFGPRPTPAVSGEETASPSASFAYPILKGEGCFIATAAYGFYSSWQVQALRDFRDRYLLTNAPGRAFVAWYYTYGPIGAHYLNQHPALKPLVRVLLFPLVVLGIFLTATSAPTKVAVLALSLLACTVLFRRRLAVRWGGVR